MVRLRWSLQAVPSRVWTAVGGLAALASLSIAAVLGAGLQVWQGAVGGHRPPAPHALTRLPNSGVVTVPSTPPPPAPSPGPPTGGGAAVVPQAAAPPAAGAAAVPAPVLPVAVPTPLPTPLPVQPGTAAETVAGPPFGRAFGHGFGHLLTAATESTGRTERTSVRTAGTGTERSTHGPAGGHRSGAKRGPGAGHATHAGHSHPGGHGDRDAGKPGAAAPDATAPKR